MKKTIIFCSLCVAGLSTTTAADAPGSAIATMIRDGEASVALRYRVEAVNQDNTLRDARAGTLRTRVTLQSAALNGVDALLEMDNILVAGPGRYDSFMQNRYRGRYSVIADPAGTNVNQARLAYTVDEQQRIELGRQRINHGNQRFVGGVGWRQNEQTYDAVRYQYQDDGLSLDYAWLWNVNRVFDGRGTSDQAVNFRSNSHVAHAQVALAGGTASAWMQVLDFSNAPAQSRRTAGLGYQRDFSGVALDLAWARQSAHGNNPERLSVDYRRAELSTLAALTGPLRLRAGYEVLGSDSGATAFSTPLATLHAWQGFADLFLNTPDNGIRDFYLGAAARHDALSLALTWHDYRADHGSSRYGREWNLAATWRLSEHINAEAKMARYQRTDFAVDTDKFWLTVNMAF